MYFYFGFLNFYANANVFVNKLMYISEEILWCFYFFIFLGEENAQKTIWKLFSMQYPD